MPDFFTFGNWRDRLLDASFRGVPFKVSRHEYTFGRRTKVYELWGQNNTAVYDQGGKAEYFDLECYIVQNDENKYDYWKEKFDLISALRKKGFGILVHPYLGKLYVSIFEEQSVEEDVEQGGIVIFKLKFVQNRAPVLTQYALAQSANVDAQVAKTTAAASDSMAGTMGGPRLLTGASGGRLISSGQVSLYQDSLLGGIKNILGKMSSALSQVKGAVSSVINEAQNTLYSIISTVDQFLDAPCDLAKQLNSASDSFLTICGIGEDVITDVVKGACSGLNKEDPTILDGTSIPQDLGDSIVTAILDTALDFDSDTFGNVTDVQAANVRAITYAAQMQLLSKALQVSIRTQFLQRNRYESLLAKLRLAFDSLLFSIGEYPDNTEIFSATEDARNVFFTNALNRLDLLSRQISYTVPPVVQTALHVAYNRYNDLDRDSEIMALNRITVDHPGFLPQGQEIQILDE